MQDRVARFFLALDTGNAEALVALMHPQGTWMRRGVALDGHAAIRAMMLGRQADRVIRHVVTNAIVDDIGRELLVRTYVTAFSGPVAVDGPAPMAGAGTVFDFEHRLLRCADDWLITSVSSKPILRRSVKEPAR